MFEDVVVSAQRFQVVRVISMALLVTEWIILLMEEIELIWKSRWGFTKILFLVSRYIPFIDTSLNLVYYLKPVMSSNACLINYRIGSISTIFGVAISELILITRTYALYGCSRKVAIWLGAIWIVWVAGNVPIVYVFLTSLVYESPPTPKLPGCYPVSESPIVFVSFATLLLMEILIVVMTGRKAWQQFRWLRGSSAVLTVLYRDGFLFFMCMLLGSIGNVLVLVSSPPEYYDLLNTFTRVVHATLCCRVLLNLRRARARELDSEAPGPLHSGALPSALQFGSVGYGRGSLSAGRTTGSVTAAGDGEALELRES